MSSCIGLRYLPPGQQLLVRQHLEGVENLDRQKLSSLYVCTPNRRILFLPWSPYVYIYQMGLKAYDTAKYEGNIKRYGRKYDLSIQQAERKKQSKKAKRLREKRAKKTQKQKRNLKEGNWAMRIGAPLALFDTAKENMTTRKMTAYLHTKGYFDAQVTYDTTATGKFVTAEYTIARHEPYTIDSVIYHMPDTAIEALIQQHHAAAFLRTGKRYEQAHLVKERDRINALLLNHGYYAFSRKFVHFVVDSTTLGQHRLLIEVNITSPADAARHKKYVIDSVIFTSGDRWMDDDHAPVVAYDQGTAYQFYARRYATKILNRRTFIKPKALYSRRHTLQTQRQLSDLDIFKFVNVNYDTTGGRFIAHIHTQSLKKFETSFEAGLNVSEGLPGPFANASIKNRNTFRALEIVELSGHLSYEGLTGAASVSQPYTSLMYGMKLGLTFPQITLPLGRRFRSYMGKFNPKTKLSLGLNYDTRREYHRTTLNASLGFAWQNHAKQRSHTLTLADINYVRSDVTPGYQQFLDSLSARGNNLSNSFVSSFVNSVWYAAVHNINGYGNKHQPSSYFNYRVELGGYFFQLIRQLGFRDDVNFFKFIKADVDFRHNHPFSPQVILAYRFKAGIAFPYGDNQTLPYEKFYFTGGSNSVRAWAPRRLGPGAYLPLERRSNGKLFYNNNFEQPGEILFESSLEFRHKIIGFVHGALFIDAGNVWMLHQDPVRPGSRFNIQSFFKEIAIGGGYGLRFDFSFLLIRIDAAWKLYDPGSQSIFLDQTLTRDHLRLPSYPGYQRLVWNIGIGYPF